MLHLTLESFEHGEGHRDRALTLYHGSPYVFDKFDLSKFGTGDGRSKYGFGLYMTSSKDTAVQYAKDNTLKFHEDGTNLYTLRVDTTSYMPWDAEIAESLYMQIVAALEAGGYESDADTMRQELEDYGSTWTGDSTYQYLEAVLGSAKAASEFLNDVGTKGHYVTDYPFYSGGSVFVSYGCTEVRIVDVAKADGEDLDESYAGTTWYHGSRVKFDSFKLGLGAANTVYNMMPDNGLGVFLTDNRIMAACFAGAILYDDEEGRYVPTGDTGYIYKVDVSPGKVLEFGSGYDAFVDYANDIEEAGDKDTYRDKLLEDGFDSVLISDLDINYYEDGVYDVLVVLDPDSVNIKGVEEYK